jgi:lipopolysaccharide/colanic/teichoic acid biosynthesis glycosyltransferase
MINLLFKGRAVLRSSKDAPARAGTRYTSHDGWLLSEDDFARALSLESKRAERSRKLLLLMLLDASKLREIHEDNIAHSAIFSALSASTRETDMRGWYKRGSIIGVIFTEISEGEKNAVGGAVLSRVTKLLETNLSPARTKCIVVSLKFFPEEWVLRRRDSNGGAQRHVDSLRNNDSKAAARAIKRAIDVAGSGLALVALSPLYAVIAIAIKLSSKGPVFFRQERVGQRGRIFECLKFRSMRVASDSSIHQEYVRNLISGSGNSATGPRNPDAVYKIKNDPRVTRLGRFLRKTSLDELPQFWNVLKGEMSLVGPRPPIPYEMEWYDIWHRRRVFDVKPGITGLWQVYGRSRTTFDEMVRLDLRYAKTWSIWLDLEIILKTPKAVFSGEGAY